MGFNLKKNAAAKRTDKQYGKRARGLVAFFLALITIIGVFRLGFIMAFQGGEYRAKAEQQQLYDEIIPPVRGTIYDSNMTPLVTGMSAWILVADPKSIVNDIGKLKCSKLSDGQIYETPSDEISKAYLNYMSGKLAKILGEKKADVYKSLSKTNTNYVRLKRKIGAAQRLKLDELFDEDFVYGYYAKKRNPNKGKILPKSFKCGLFFRYEDDSLRIYPDNNFASTVIGVLDYDGNGMTGVERAYNDVMKGEAGRKVTARNGRNEPIEARYETLQQPTEGNGVVLTIDSNIQMYLENALKTALAKEKAKGVFGMVMDVDTGAVLAISDKPDFDLNDAHKIIDPSKLKELEAYKDKTSEEYLNAQTAALYDQWNNYCVTNTYEPGSTFKIFTAAAALEEGVVSLGSSYTCRGAIKIADRVIHCAKREGHGYQTFTQGLMNSCNPFFIDIGQKLGAETYFKYFDAFGFTSKTGIDLTGEASPIYHPLKRFGKVELASTSFGQSVRLSPIQMITAGCAIANGGKLMKPYVVDSIVNSNGTVISKTQPEVRRQVISESTASTVRQMMEAVVEGGTGKNAYIPGYRVAGKTATSQKLDLKNEEAEENEKEMKYVASFLCFAPADDPKVAILVGVDEPPGQYRGGGVIAAPIAKEVMIPTLKYLNVKPQYTAEELAKISKTAPDLIGDSVSRAKSRAQSEGLTVRAVGSGETVISQVPAAGQSIPAGGVVVIYTKENTKAQVVEVPDFAGMSASGANQAAAAAGLNIIISGPASEAGAEVYSQSIRKGTKVQTGSSVTLNFHSTTKTVD